jgi:hypothetical protein
MFTLGLRSKGQGGRAEAAVLLVDAQVTWLGLGLGLGSGLGSGLGLGLGLGLGW